MIDLSLLKQGIGISGEDMAQIHFSNLSRIQKVITIENLTSFFRYHEENSLLIYLGGYHNRIRMDLDTLKQYLKYGKSLTESDRKRLERLYGEGEFREVIDFMLKENIKLEQECII